MHVVSPEVPPPLAAELAAAARADDDARLADALDALDRATAAGVTVASDDADAGIDARVATAGFVPVRELLQLRRPLPHPATTSLAVRPFAPGQDDERWLAVNNAAFAWHPEQQGWDGQRLATEVARPWVDLDGFLVHDGPDGLDGFCWTKLHPAVADEPALGEIYVIGVDPASHRRGLGRDLVLAGLAHLAGRGPRTAVLWVEHDNAPARRLYDDLAFGIHRRHRWYRHRRTVA